MALMQPSDYNVNNKNYLEVGDRLKTSLDKVHRMISFCGINKKSIQVPLLPGYKKDGKNYYSKFEN